MAVLVTIAPEAILEIVAIATWWRRNRTAAPRLFQTELDAAVLLIAEQPDVGRRARTRRRPQLRVLTLLRSRYLVFYEHRPEFGDVVITRVRHGYRRPLSRASHQR